MKYYEFKFIFKPKNEIVSDILMSVLGDVGFESFVEEDDVLKAYIQQSLFNKEELQTSINQFPIEVDAVDYTYTEAEDKDWNEEWEIGRASCRERV